MKMSYEKCDPIDLARLAAYIDGEGSIYIVRCSPKRNKGATELRLTVTNTDVRLMAWMKEKFAGYVNNKHSSPKDRRWKECYEWKLCSNKAAAVLEACLPYFIIKRDQAEVALAHQRLVASVKKRPVCERTQAAQAIIPERESLRISLSKLKGHCGIVHQRASEVTIQ